MYHSMRFVYVNVDLMHVFVMTNKVGIMINAEVNVKNWLIKKDVIKNLLRILVIVNVWIDGLWTKIIKKVIIF